jgi:hypothetical protein
MKNIFSLTLFAAAAALTAIPAGASMLFNQNPPNANSINMTDSRVADNFTLFGSAVLDTINFWYQTDVLGTASDLSTVAWSIYSNSGGSLGSALYSGTTTAATSFDAVNNADFASFAVPSLALPAGTYWLELHAGSSLTSDNGGLTIWWSNVDGVPSLAALYNSALGLPNTHETFPGFEAMAFQLVGSGVGNVPEPTEFQMLTVGLVLLACGKAARGRATDKDRTEP